MENEIKEEEVTKTEVLVDDKASELREFSQEDGANQATTQGTNLVGIPASKPASRFKKMLTVKRIVIAVIIIIVLVGAYYAKSLVVAATVNGSIISRLEVVQSLEKQDGKAALTSMINERLINMEAANRKITVTDDEVNVELTKIETQLTAQGTTLDAALAEQSLTRDDISKRIKTQKELEKMLADKIAVTDAEVQKYITDNKVTLTKGKEAEEKTSISDQLKSTKLNTEAQAFVTDLNTKATIKHFVNY